MQYNISFDIAALLNLSIILFIYLKKIKIHSFQNNILLSMIIATSVASIFDILSSIAISYSHFFPLSTMKLICTVFYLFSITIFFLSTLYIVATTDVIQNTQLFQKVILFIPEIICIIIALVNHSKPCLFYFDENLKFHYGTAMYIYYFFAFYYILLSFSYVIRYKKYLEAAILYSLYFFLGTVLTFSIIQMIYPSLLIDLFGVSLGLLIMLLNIQKPEKMINSRTELLNRDAMNTILEKKFYLAEKFTIISLKLKDLSFLNKTFGTAYVNDTIKIVAAFLKTLCQKDTQIFHVGFGQFCLVYPSLNSAEIAKMVDTLQKRFSLPWNTGGIEVDLDFRLNIGHAPEDFSDYESLSDFIDYKPDETLSPEQDTCFSEKFQVIYAKDSVSHVIQRTQNIEHAIRRALHEGNFQVYYQPIYSVKENKFTCAEALICLWDREYGMISPEEFIPIAEKNGTILDIGIFVFETVCKFISEEHLDKLGVEYIEINLSVVQCMQPKLAEQLLSIMNQYHIRPEQINLEITETAAAVSPETLKLNMMTLAEQGIHFSLDDYGTGYSTMSYALDLPFSYIKLDKSIVTSAASNRNTHIALCSTIQMMKQLNFMLIAEGIDNKEQLEILMEHDCDYIQGYYFSTPLPKDGYLEFLRTHHTTESMAYTQNTMIKGNIM